MNNYKPDFVELATYCQNRFKESVSGPNNKYIQTLFVKIDEKGVISTSTTPHILEDATSCILIHTRNALAVSFYYDWHTIQYINPKGQVFDSYLDDVFHISTGSYNNSEKLSLGIITTKWAYNSYRIETYYTCDLDKNGIQKLWNLYTRLKDIETSAERKMIADLFIKDEKIQQLETEIKNLNFTNMLLEKERNQYKDLLDKIQALINKN